jgi:hypothetical protein
LADPLIVPPPCACQAVTVAHSHATVVLSPREMPVG